MSENRDKREIQVCVFDITIKEGELKPDDVKTWFKDIAKKWCFQLEQGEESGYRHYQCRISLKVKQRLSAFVKTIPEEFSECHVSVTSNPNKTNNFYILKRDSRLEGPWQDIDRYIPQWLLGTPEWYDWQQSVLDRTIYNKNTNTREVNCIIDLIGNNGKSFLGLWLAARGLASRIPFMNDTKDIARMIMDKPKVGTYFVDLPRATNKKYMDNFIAAMEELKNGYAYDDRYHFKEEFFEPPHVWIFTNKVPDTTLLSKDRWNFYEIIKSETGKFVLAPFASADLE